MLGMNEIMNIEAVLKEHFDNHLEEILIKLNHSGKIEELLRVVGLHEILGIQEESLCARDGKIIVIGKSDVDKDKLQAIARNMGFSKDRFEFYLDYDAAKSFDFKKTQWSSAYSCIMVGQMPHSGLSKGDYSSIITALESQEGYPPVIRLGLKGLKITKTSFRDALELLVSEGKIVA